MINLYILTALLFIASLLVVLVAKRENERDK